MIMTLYRKAADQVLRVVADSSYTSGLLGLTVELSHCSSKTPISYDRQPPTSAALQYRDSVNLSAPSLTKRTNA
jgi:hypothetical protein